MKDQNSTPKSWVYSLSDYRQIFDLQEQDLQKDLLDFPAGISSVNAELTALGHRMTSGDPAYVLNFPQMQEFARKLLKQMILAAGENLNQNVLEDWQKSTELFLQDYEMGKKQERYIPIGLPPLSTIHKPKELLLCTDLFVNAINSQFISTAELMNTLTQLASEVRIFPIAEDKTAVNSTLGPIMLEFQRRNFGVEVRAIKYSQRCQCNAMLRIWAKECAVSQ